LLTCPNTLPSAGQRGHDHTELHAATPFSPHNSGISREQLRDVGRHARLAGPDAAHRPECDRRRTSSGHDSTMRSDLFKP
jgi:hypothetical protein